MPRVSLLFPYAFAVFTLPALFLTGLSQSSPGRDANGTGRIRGPIVETESVTLLGNTHPLARPENDRGQLPGNTPLNRMILLLKPSAEQHQGLKRMADAQGNEVSPLYRHWLTPDEYGRLFGATSKDLEQVTGWLRSHGFSVEPVAAGRRLLVFSGTAAQVEEAFHVQMRRYEVNGQLHTANSDNPQIPAALAPVISGVVSLNDFHSASQVHTIRSITSPTNTEGGAQYLFPADFATIYNLNPVYKAGKTGTGQTIAIVGRSNINLSDVSSFRSYMGLTANAPAVVLDGPDPGLVPGDQDEATLDVEWSGGVAPGASIKLVAAASTSTTDGVDLAAAYIVNNKIAPVMSTSFGNCEAFMGATELAFYNSLWQQAAAEGISAFVSAGDSGASGCDSGASSQGTVTAVNGLCSSPYSTCVGGTEFNEGSNAGKYWSPTNGAGGGSALSYIPEKVWNESGSDGGSGLWASGGGISGVYVQPSWQKGIPGANSNGMRAVPDVALTSAGHDGYVVCLNNSWYVFGGTSASSPSFAGIQSLVVQQMKGIGQGSINPILYGLLNASVDPFHATPSGNNSVPGVGGFSASGNAYNLATGLGSVNASLLLSAWPAGSTVSVPGFTLNAAANAATLLPGSSMTFTVSVLASGGFTGQVSLSSQTTGGVSLKFNPAVIKPGATSTVTVTASTATVAGVHSLSISGTSGTLQSVLPFTLTVLPPPTLSISAATSSISVAQSGTATLVITTVTGGSYAGPVTLAIANMPAGITASWNAGGFNPTGSSSTSRTLTLKPGPTQALTSAVIKITATGDGLSAQVPVTIQIQPKPALAISVSNAAVSLAQSGTATVTVTTATGGSYAGAVTLNVTNLPQGITATWNAGSFSPTGTSSTARILTLKAGANQAATSVVLSITATGDGLTAQVPVTVRISGK